jgi:hypothetical protein
MQRGVPLNADWFVRTYCAAEDDMVRVALDYNCINFVYTFAGANPVDVLGEAKAAHSRAKAMAEHRERMLAAEEVVPLATVRKVIETLDRKAARRRKITCVKNTCRIEVLLERAREQLKARKFERKNRVYEGGEYDDARDIGRGAFGYKQNPQSPDTVPYCAPKLHGEALQERMDRNGVVPMPMYDPKTQEKKEGTDYFGIMPQLRFTQPVVKSTGKPGKARQVPHRLDSIDRKLKHMEHLHTRRAKARAARKKKALKDRMDYKFMRDSVSAFGLWAPSAPESHARDAYRLATLRLMIDIEKAMRTGEPMRKSAATSVILDYAESEKSG